MIQTQELKMMGLMQKKMFRPDRPRRLFNSFFFLCLWSSLVYSQTIRVTGSTWVINIGDPSVPAGGNAFTDVESPTDQVLIDVHAQADRGWEITVNKTGSPWDNAMVLSVKRTGDGSGGGTVDGGLSYVAILDGPSLFFTGGKNKTNIPCRYLLHCNDFPYEGTYNATVYYTITGTL